jgi:hypothetical protein
MEAHHEHHWSTEFHNLQVCQMMQVREKQSLGVGEVVRQQSDDTSGTGSLEMGEVVIHLMNLQ